MNETSTCIPVIGTSGSSLPAVWFSLHPCKMTKCSYYKFKTLWASVTRSPVLLVKTTKSRNFFIEFWCILVPPFFALSANNSHFPSTISASFPHRLLRDRQFFFPLWYDNLYCTGLISNLSKANSFVYKCTKRVWNFILEYLYWFGNAFFQVNLIYESRWTVQNSIQ